jgi:hypothetical protein
MSFLFPQRCKRPRPEDRPRRHGTAEPEAVMPARNFGPFAAFLEKRHQAQFPQKEALADYLRRYEL